MEPQINTPPTMSAPKAPPTPTQPPSTAVGTHKFKEWFRSLGLSDKVVIPLLSAAVLLIAVDVAGLTWGYYHRTNLGIVALPADLAAKQEALIKKLESEGKYGEVHQIANAAIAGAQSNSQQYEVYLDQGSAAEKLQKYSDALTAYQKAQSVFNNYTTTTAVGRVAEKMGNKSLAISSYQAAMQLIVLGPLADSQRAALQHSLQVLGS